MEEPGIECCLWPHLYWNSDFCETIERATDVRRLERIHGGRDRIPAGWESDDEAEMNGDDEELQHTRHCLRRFFMDKVFGSVPGYGVDFEHLQFIFDLWLWNDIGGKRNKFQNTPMRLLVKQAPWSPGYWKLRPATCSGHSISKV